MSIEEIRGAVARGWCRDGNAHKEMDTVLAEAISQEIITLLTPGVGAETSAAPAPYVCRCCCHTSPRGCECCTRQAAHWKAEAERQSKRMCVGGDVFEANRNQHILHLKTEAEYLERAEKAEAEAERLRAERDEAIRLAKIVSDKVAFLAISDKSYDEYQDAVKRLTALGREEKL